MIAAVRLNVWVNSVLSPHHPPIDVLYVLMHILSLPTPAEFPAH